MKTGKIKHFDKPKLYFFRAHDHSSRKTSWRDVAEYDSDLVVIDIVGWVVAEDNACFHLAWGKAHGSEDKATGFTPGFTDHWFLPKATVIKKKKIDVPIFP